MMDVHPSDSLLLDYVAGTAEQARELEEHLAFCTACRVVVDRLRRAGFGERGGFDDLDDLGPVPVAPGAPEALVSSLAGADRPDLAPGQLWRAAPEGRHEMLLVWVRQLRADGRPAVVPVTFDPEFADQYDLIVPAEQSPLGVELALHTTSEGTIDSRALVDRIADIDLSTEIEAVRRARREGTRAEGLAVGTPVTGLHDERVEYRKRLTDLIVAMGTARFEPDRSAADEDHDQLSEPDLQDDALDALLEDGPLADFVRELEGGLAYSYPQCRLLPVAWTDGGVLRPAATLLNIDVFVRLVLVESDPGLIGLIEASRATFDADLSASAVCFSLVASDQFDSWLIDRDAVIAASGDHLGGLPNVESVITGSLVEVLTKYFDRVVDPFRKVGTTTMDQVFVDPSALAAESASAAVDEVVSKAAGYRVPGKRPGYERVARHKQLVISIVEQALQPEGVDVHSALGEDQ